MNTLHSDIRPVSDATLQELIRLVDGMCASLDETKWDLSARLEPIVSNIHAQMAMKCVDYLEHYVRGNVFTRRKWKRRIVDLIKASRSFKDIILSLNDM